MKGRVKLEIWSENFQRWKSAYCLVTMLHENLIHLKEFGFTVRVGGRVENF